MRVLQVNKFFYRRGGAEVVFFDTINGLKERGYDVIEFSMQHSHNLPSGYSAYFSREIPELTSKQSIKSDWNTFKNLFSSEEIEKKIKALVLATEPEVAHLHNVTRQLSASLFTTLKKLEIPMVFTVHDVQPMCPNHRMIRNHTICEKCHRHKYYNCARYKCINDSRAQSVAGALEAYFYYLKGIWKMVDIFVCPSQFMLDKMVAWGFPAKKMRLVRNPFSAPAKIAPLGDKIVYMGRLHEEKGIKIFMEAATKLRNYKIIIAGTGPEEEMIEKIIRQNSLTNVERIGWAAGDKWKKIMDEARVIVVPSLFYENCSITILEALGNGRIVVAADRGGNNELVINGETGFLAKPEDPDSFADLIRRAMELKDYETDKIINNSRNLIENNHSPDGYFKSLGEIYGALVK